MKYVVVGSTPDLKYSFFLPIIDKIWLNFGYRLCSVLIGDWSSPIHSFIKSNLCNFYILEARSMPEGTLAQVSRLYASELFNLNKNDTMMTSDVDMLPLNKEWFNRSRENKLNLYFANAYNYEKYPMCYVDASKEIWGEIINESLDTVMSKNLHWGFDEEYLGIKIKSWHRYPLGCNFIERKHPPGTECPSDRLDRACWHYSGRIRDYVDAHCFRPFYGENFKYLDRVLRDLDIDYGFMKDYRNEFLRLIGE